MARLNFAKKESRSPRGFLPRPLLRAGESESRTPPPFPQKKEVGCGQEFRSKKVRANAKITPQNSECPQSILRRPRMRGFCVAKGERFEALARFFGACSRTKNPQVGTETVSFESRSLR